MRQSIRLEVTAHVVDENVTSGIAGVFFETVPLMKPRMLWFCQLVALAISPIVAPSFRRRSSRTMAVLLPSRDFDVEPATLHAFFVPVFAFAACFGLALSALSFRSRLFRSATCLARD